MVWTPCLACHCGDLPGSYHHDAEGWFTSCQSDRRVAFVGFGYGLCLLHRDHQSEQNHRSHQSLRSWGVRAYYRHPGRYRFLGWGAYYQHHRRYLVGYGRGNFYDCFYEKVRFIGKFYSGNGVKVGRFLPISAWNAIVLRSWRGDCEIFFLHLFIEPTLFD